MLEMRRRAGDLTSVVCTRFSDTEKAWLEDYAETLGLTASDIVRAAVKYYRARQSDRAQVQP